ncbi:MAG: hypothetical protein M3342_10555, partial [Bacteroidota bacterium]|nr:hypothetical protein [Bacteroidota bacterium]
FGAELKDIGLKGSPVNYVNAIWMTDKEVVPFTLNPFRVLVINRHFLSRVSPVATDNKALRGSGVSNKKELSA